MKDIRIETSELLEMLDRDNMLSFAIGSLISADTLLSAEDCRRAEVQLATFLDALDIAEIKNKERWRTRIEEGLEIVRRDKAAFEENDT
jgi:hypothetical protein